jgi:hypothetical protein
VNLRRWGRFHGGGSSVLVTFLMLFLVTLGVFAVSSSNANLRLAQKGVSWVKSYYALEAGAEALLEIISRALSQAGTHTTGGEYIDSGALAGIITQCLEPYTQYNTQHGQIQLPYGTVLEQFKVEPIGPGSVNISGRLARQHGSTEQHLLVEIQVCSGSGESAGWGFRITQWKQYQEPFEYQQGFDLWHQPQ